jgi:hypothetical protein
VATPTSGAPQRAPSEDPPAFTTASLPLSAFLSARGHTADVRLDPESRRAVFAFAPSAALDADLSNYQSGSATIVPDEYEAARARLLSRISAARGGAR